MTPSNPHKEDLEHRALQRLGRLLEVIADLLSEAAELGVLPASIRASVLTLMRETARLQGGVEWIVERVVVLSPTTGTAEPLQAEPQQEEEGESPSAPPESEDSV